MRCDAGNTIGRLVSVCEQIGVSTIASTLGATIGPPADSEYAVEPVAVEMMRPSARYAVAYCPSTETARLMIRLIADLVMTMSLSAMCSQTAAPLRMTRARSMRRSSTTI